LSSIKRKIIPKKAENDYKGYKVAEIAFLIIVMLTIIRSLIHFIAPDGGAQSIATINLNIEGAEIIIGMFALWGISQLLLGIVYLIVFKYYKNLIPLMYILIILEYSLRIVVGFIKPFQTMGIAPGAIGNFIILPFALVMLIFSILNPKNTN